MSCSLPGKDRNKKIRWMKERKKEGKKETKKGRKNGWKELNNKHDL